MKKRPKSRWRIVIAGVGAAEVTARWFGEAVRKAARMLVRTVTTSTTRRDHQGVRHDVTIVRQLPHKLVTDFETGGWKDVSGERLGPAILTTKS